MGDLHASVAILRGVLMTYKAYAGIGSRETPEDILYMMTGFANLAQGMGWTLRSGAADGADKAFEAGVTDGTKKEIFLPWGMFNGSRSMLFPPSPMALEMASRVHPNWEACSQGAQKLHARNIHQILGLNLTAKDAVKFVLCWTKGGQRIGGTSTAIRVAEMYNIPVFNMGDPNMDEAKLEAILGA